MFDQTSEFGSKSTSTDGVNNIANLLKEILEELTKATEKFGPFNSMHEGYAVILEELDELWDEIKLNNLNKAREEAVQVAAMAIRFLCDLYGIDLR